MKTKCKTLKLSILIWVISIILFSIFYLLDNCYNNIVLEYFYNIFLGLFGSSFVVFLIAIPEYLTAKNNTLIRFFEELKRILMVFDKIEFNFVEFNVESLTNYIKELNDKKWKETYNNISNKKMIIRDGYYKEKLKKEYLKHRLLQSKVKSKELLDKYTSNMVEKEIKKIRTNNIKIMKQYIELSNESTVELYYILQDIEFFSGKKNYIKLCKKFYNPIIEKMEIIKEESYHFRLFLEKKGNEAVALEKALSLQKEFFAIEKEQNQEWIYYLIEPIFLSNLINNFNEMSKELFRSNVDVENVDIGNTIRVNRYY